jgi:hypothetical protein
VLLALALNLIPVANAALIVILLYGGYYGAIEATERIGLSAPGSNWQIPQRFVIGVPRARRVLVWGSILGPGFATRNAFAGFALLPIAIATVGNVAAGVGLGAAIGFAHGAGRATALVRDARQAATIDYLELTLKKMRWRMIDGYLLMLIAGVSVAAIMRGAI